VTDGKRIGQVPNSLDSEQQILGAILKDQEVPAKVFRLITGPEVFYSPKHRTLYRAMMALNVLGEPIDPTIVGNYLHGLAGDQLKGIGGRVYLVELMEGVASTALVDRWCEIVIEKFRLRSIMEVCGKVSGTAQEESEGALELVSSITRDLMPLMRRTDEHEFGLLGNYVTEVVGTLQDIAQHHKPTGIATGFEDIDTMTSGFHKADLIVIGGRPSNGKTALLNCLATNQVVQGRRVGVFSAETKAQEYALRSLCTQARIDSMTAKRGMLNESEWNGLTIHMNEMTSWNYWINYTTAIDIPTLTMLATDLVEREHVDVIYLDYLQKMARPKGMQEREGMAYITVSLKNLAKTLDVPVVILSQLNRDMEKRQNKRPQLSDFKGCGEIEQEADLVMALFRPELYIGKKKKGEKQWQGICEVHLLKQRNGPIGVVNLNFHPKYTRFETFVEAAEPELPY
jgi:replicative DNA helicase